MKLSEAVSKFNQWRSFKVKHDTVKGYGMALRQFGLFMRNCELEKITLDDVLSWFNLMKNFNWDQNSLLIKAMALRKFFEFWQKQGYQVIDPCLIPIPRRQVRLPRVVTADQYKRLLAVIPQNNDPRHIRNRAIIQMLWDTGARVGEIVSLDIDDVDLNRKKAIIKTEKNRGSRPIREIFWTEQTNNSLLKWLKKREGLTYKMVIKDPMALFISVCSGPNNTAGRRFGIKGVGEMLRRYSHRAGLPVINAHSFRHRVGRAIIENGGSAADVANILGHSTLASSTIYTMMTDKELEKRYRQILGAVD